MRHILGSGDDTGGRESKQTVQRKTGFVSAGTVNMGRFPFPNKKPPNRGLPTPKRRPPPTPKRRPPQLQKEEPPLQLSPVQRPTPFTFLGSPASLPIASKASVNGSDSLRHFQVSHAKIDVSMPFKPTGFPDPSGQRVHLRQRIGA